MGKTYHTLSMQNVQTLTDIIAPDLIESPAFLNASIFERLAINVLSGTEFERTQNLFRGKGGEARAYEQGTTLESTVGFVEQRKLRVEQTWARYVENIQNFREKEPFSVLGSNQSYNAPVTETIIRNIGKLYSGDVFNNMFFGKRAVGKAMGLFDGFWTQIDKEINETLISKGNMNFVEIDPIVGQPDAAVGEIYATFVQFVENWHPQLRDAERVIVYCSTEAKRLIVTDYMKTFTGFQKESNANNSFRFFDLPNIELVSHAAMGKGSRLLATTPYNLEFGLDSLNDFNSVMVHPDQNDFNNVIFQIQSTQGVRILDTSSKKFCVSNGTNTPIEGLVGDYQKNTLRLFANDSTMGTIAASPSKEEYDKGESVTMTPTPKSGHKFVKWADNAVSNPRTIIYSGYPETYEAIFEADASGE